MFNHGNARGTRAAVPLLLAVLAAACVDESHPLEPSTHATADDDPSTIVTVAVRDAIERLAPVVDGKTGSQLVAELRGAAVAIAARDTHAARLALDRAEHALGHQDADGPDPDTDAIRLALDAARSGLEGR